LLKYLKAIFIYLTDLFSVKLIFRTLFMPWKRDQISAKGLPLNERFNIWLLNLVSRFVGFAVKSLFFVVYLIFSAGLSIVSLVAIVFWFLMPLLVAGLLIVGFSQILIYRNA